MERSRQVPEYLNKRPYGKQEMQIVKVDTTTLAPFFRSKEDIYKWLTEH